MVIASRYLAGAKSYDNDTVTAFGNWMFTKIINILFGGHYTDTLVGFRAWKKSCLTKSRPSQTWQVLSPLVQSDVPN